MKLLYNLFFFPPEPILVIVRLAENGCLLSHLRKNRERQYINFKAESAVHFTPVDKITIARDVANGMLHLSNKKVKIYIYIFVFYISLNTHFYANYTWFRIRHHHHYHHHHL